MCIDAVATFVTTSGALLVIISVPILRLIMDSNHHASVKQCDKINMLQLKLA